MRINVILRSMYSGIIEYSDVILTDDEHESEDLCDFERSLPDSLWAEYRYE